MNAEETLDYTLGRLEPHERDEFERLLRSDPLLAERVDLLNTSVHRLLDDGLSYDPPEGLAGRTIAFVGQAKTRSVSPLFTTSRSAVPHTDGLTWPSPRASSSSAC